MAEVNAELYQKPLPARLAYAGALRDREGAVLYERMLHPLGGASAQETVQGSAIGISNAFGKGRTFYANWTPLPYLLVRSTEEGRRQRARITRQLAWRSGPLTQALEPRVRVLAGGKELPLAERLFWKKDGRRYLCVVMNPLRTARIDAAGDMDDLPAEGALTITLQFRDPVVGIKNERTGSPLGNGDRFTDRWLPYEANIYSWPAAKQDARK